MLFALLAPCQAGDSTQVKETLLIDRVPDAVLAQWRRFAGQPSTRVNAGLINDTFFVTARDGTRAVFQRLHSVFDATVNFDIAAITKRLVEKRSPVASTDSNR